MGIPIQIFAGENRIERVTISDFKTNCKIGLSYPQIRLDRGFGAEILIFAKRAHEITMPETAKKERGDEFVYIGGVKRLVLDNIRIFASDNIFSGKKQCRNAERLHSLEKGY